MINIELNKILNLHKNSASGLAVSLALTRRVDNIVKELFLSENKNSFSLVALGGYGRNELCFSSDIDLMFLFDNDDELSQSESVINRILHELLRQNFVVGHSVRSIENCICLPDNDYESRNSLLESRYVCGNKAIYKKYINALNNYISGIDKSEFIDSSYRLNKERYEKYGNSSKLLEPNIKNSAGSLRDLHSVLWLLRGIGLMPLESIFKNNYNVTAIIKMFHNPDVKKLFDVDFIADVKRSYDKLLKIRNEMHLQTNSSHNIIEFDLQFQIAKKLNYRSTSKNKAVERFMQDYYLCSKNINRFCERVFSWALSRWANNIPLKAEKLNKLFHIKDKKIYLSKRAYKNITNENILTALLLSCERNLPWSFQLDDYVYRNHNNIKSFISDNEFNLFKLILHRPNGVGKIFFKINELGLLEKWIAEWQKMSSFFQHDKYHYYTADEHSLMAIYNAEKLGQSNNNFGKVFRSLPRRDTLYLSCLLHDIAKPLSNSNHEVAGVPIAKKILKKLKYSDVEEDVLFLVRNHLLMEQIAFRRNLQDPQTIIDFAKYFNRPELLDYLFVLTYADLSSVNKNVLTEWKELLLTELYKKTRSILESDLTEEQLKINTVEQIKIKKENIARILVPEFPPEEVEEHLNMLGGSSYFNSFKSEEIASHLLAIRKNNDVSVLFKNVDYFTEITFVAKDSIGLLSKLCGVLTINDANIIDAQIFTRKDGIVIDKFKAVDFISHKTLSENSCNKIIADANEIIKNNLPIGDFVTKHQNKWKRRLKPINQNIKTDVVFHQNDKHTILDIYSKDFIGLLYALTEKLSGLGLNITFAKIATRIDGVVDTFYLLDKNNNPITQESTKQLIKEELLKIINKK